MKRLFTIIFLLSVLMALFLRAPLPSNASALAESIMALGFTIMVAYLLGKAVSRYRLPKITGYMIAGILLGPFLLNAISEQSVQNLQLINNIALGLIALTAGGEFRYRDMKGQFNTILVVILFQVLIVLVGFIIFTLFYGSNIDFLSNAETKTFLGVGILLGSLAIAKSPSTTIAIITESGAKGRFTDFVLGVTVFKDIVVVLLFSILLSLAKPLILPGETIHFNYMLEVVLELGLSVVVGVAAGGLILLYLKYVGTQTVLFLLGFVLLGIEVSAMLHVELVLVFMVAGFFVQNFSDNGGKLIEAIEEGSLPIYVTFFAIAGASLNIPIFLNNFWLAIIIVVLRIATTFSGTFLGGKLTHSTPEVQKLGWMGFIGQAGLTLGLVSIVSANFPGTIGTNVQTLTIAAVTINQIIGPILFRISLEKANEITVS